VRVLLADRNTQVRWALRMAIHEQPELCVVGQASELEGLLAQAQALQPDLVVLEWELSGQPGQEMLKVLRALGLPSQILVLSKGLASRAEILAAGADLVVSKADPPELLLRVLRGLVRR
jgi:two-component system nitrate/nitrite response regulator NarL